MVGKNNKYRHEFKYFISASEIEILRIRLSAMASLDLHVGEKGQYTISSLYFDSYFNRCYHENENGTDPREKFRIRIYNHSTETIMLECKRKECGKTLKTSCPITEGQCRKLMQGIVPSDIKSGQVVLQKLAVLMYTELFRPKVIVEYERIPYVYELGNVRITFDKNIRSSSAIKNFLDENIPTRPILQSNQHILEIKYDELLPDYIKKALELGFIQTNFSKYYLCRRFSNGGIV